MRVLLDTCTLSEIRRADGAPQVKQAVAACAADDIFVSAITLGEIAYGVSRLPDGCKKNDLALWLRGIKTLYGDRILPVTAEIALLWGEIYAAAHGKGQTLTAADGLIAATSYHFGLTIMTRNVRDFKNTAVRVFNPW